MIGVNQRDLKTFTVDQERACALAKRIPADVVAVAESGIRDEADARRLAEAGYDAILVGETLVRARGPVGRAAQPDRACRGTAVSDDGSSSRSAASPPRPTPCWP